MKKKIIALVSVLIILGGGLGIYQLSATSAEAKLSKEEAESKVVNQYPGEVVEIELEEEGNKPVYEIEIEGSDKNYDLTLDGNTGEVLNLEKKTKKKTDTSKAEKETNTQQNEKVNTDDTSNTSNKKNSKSKKDDNADDGNEGSASQTQTNEKVAISEKKAREIANNQEDGEIVELELDEDDGHSYYEIEMHTNTKEVDIEIDAYSGEIIVVSKESFDD